MPAASELVAHGRDEDEVCKIIGADRLIYQELDDLIEAVRKKGKSYVECFDTSVFSGEYVTGDVSDRYLGQLELLRSDSAKQERDEAESGVIGLHNSA
jgi:amidophosphoribosyltransferase